MVALEIVVLSIALAVLCGLSIRDFYRLFAQKKKLYLAFKKRPPPKNPSAKPAKRKRHFKRAKMRFSSRRNPLPLPPIQHEELLSAPIQWGHYGPGWEEAVRTDSRLNMHHTLASIRQHFRLRGPLRPRHALDLSLSAVYRHGPEDFPEKSDVARQPDTVGLPTWRLLKNKRHDPLAIPFNLAELRRQHPSFAGQQRAPRLVQGGGAERPAKQGPRGAVEGPPPRRGADPTHPLRLGGVAEKRSPFNVKLGIGSHHSPQSNNGYSRNSYGAFYTA